METSVRPHLEVDIYVSLLNFIVSQQLSTKVVRIIWNRFTDLFVNGYPLAEILLAMEHDLLRGIGLSNNKVRYVKNVAEFSLENDMSIEYLLSKSIIICFLFLLVLKSLYCFKFHVFLRGQTCPTLFGDQVRSRFNKPISLVLCD